MVAGVLLGSVANASACPVCFSAKKGSRNAFLVTTIFMSALPWIMAGGFVVWYRKRSAELGADEEQ